MSRLAAVTGARRLGRSCPLQTSLGTRRVPSVHRGGWQDVSFALSFNAVLLRKAAGSAGGTRGRCEGGMRPERRPQEAGNWGPAPPPLLPQSIPQTHSPQSSSPLPRSSQRARQPGSQSLQPEPPSEGNSLGEPQVRRKGSPRAPATALRPGRGRGGGPRGLQHTSALQSFSS